MDKISKKRIKELKQKGEYDKIFEEFGSNAYINNTPTKIKDAEIKKMTSEGRYEDIYRKYGEETYNNFLFYLQYSEIKEAKGKFKAWLWKTTKTIKFYTTALFATAASFVVGTSLPAAYITQQNIEDNAKEYAEEIEDYDKKITEYADRINEMKLDDVQVFMKVMDDMWDNIQGYKKPEKDITGFFELDLATEEGYGVCRNMASDVAKKLDKINPEYNARTKVVRLGEDGYYVLANIDQKVLEEDDLLLASNEDNLVEVEQDDELDWVTIKGEDNPNITQEEKSMLEKIVEDAKKRTEEFSEDLADKILDGVESAAENFAGNHMVTLVDVPSDNLTVVIDPTNPGLGIYKDGKILMMNSDFESGVTYETRSYFDALVSKGGIKGFSQNTQDYIKSFRKPNLTEEEIKQKYGVLSQNIALDEVRRKDPSINVLKKTYRVMPMQNGEDKEEKKEVNKESIEREDDELER